VVIAVAFASSQSFGHRAEFRLAPGQTARLAGHEVTYLGSRQVRHPNRVALEASVRVDGKRVMRPALSEFPFATQAVGTPSVRVGPVDDVYLTLVQGPSQPGGEAVIGVVVQPLVSWLWVGGGLMGLGTLLAAVPGRRRRPTQPASDVSADETAGAGPPPRSERELEPVMSATEVVAGIPGS
jgi:cytochrome c-type biogenesis protein CcmF